MTEPEGSTTPVEPIDVRFGPRAGGTPLHPEHRQRKALGEGLSHELRAGDEPGWRSPLAPLEARAAR